MDKDLNNIMLYINYYFSKKHLYLLVYSWDVYYFLIVSISLALTKMDVD